MDACTLLATSLIFAVEVPLDIEFNIHNAIEQVIEDGKNYDPSWHKDENGEWVQIL